MKHLFKNPQKKGKAYICNSQDKISIELNEIKIKNLKKLNDNNGYFFECNISNKYNSEQLNLLKNIDNDAKESLYHNYNEWFNTEDENEDIINDIYINSLDDDNLTIILSNKIDTILIINEEEKDIEDFINFINANKKNKNLIINVNIIFLGIYINKNNIINKWAFKSINIETIVDNNNPDWNREEIEEEWKFDLISFEEEVKIKINKLELCLDNSKKLFNEIINEKNLKIWEIKIDKLKNNILSIYDNR